MKTLIVEDDYDSRQLLTRFLSPYGDCNVAANGEEAVAVFRASLEENDPYELVCLDVNMPKMNGYEALETMRKMETDNGISHSSVSKIIMITSDSDQYSVSMAFKKGASRYIVKPITKEGLISRLDSLGLMSC